MKISYAGKYCRMIFAFILALYPIVSFAEIASKSFVENGLADKQQVIVEKPNKAEAEAYAVSHPGVLVMYPE